MPRYDFTAGQILTAAQMDALSDQTVMTFAGTAARGSAIPSPTEGMVTYLADQDQLQVYTNAWRPISRILQVIQTIKTDAFTTTSSSYTTVTGLTATITPSTTASKVLILVQIASGSNNAGPGGNFRLSGGNSTVYVGDAAGNRTRNAFGGFVDAALSSFSFGNSIIYLDSPATTSATTYEVQTRIGNTAGTVFVNRAASTTDDADRSRSASSITVMEVAP